MPLWKRFSVVIILIGAVASVLHPQSFFAGEQRPRFNTISRLDGLPNSSVSSIQQDANGFIWMGTQGGLVRYDGRRFTAYTTRPFETSSLPHDLVQTIYYDPIDDSVWAGTYSGLAHLQFGRPGFRTYRHAPDEEHSLSNDVVIAISRGPEGFLWVGTQSGLNRLRADGSFERVETESPIIRDLHLDSEGTLWIASHAGLSRWDPETRQVILVEADLPSPYLMAIDEIAPGRLFLGTWGLGEHPGGVAEYDRREGVRWTRQFSDNRIYTVLAASDGSYWAGSWGGGLFAVSAAGDQYEFTPETESNLASPVIYSLHEDEAGLIWVGTNGGGLHVLSPRQRNYRAFFHDPDDSTTLPPGKINVLYRDREDVLWAGLYSGGLAFYNEERDLWERRTADPENPFSLANDIVVTMSEDRQGRLWVGTNGGLQYYDRRTDRFLTWGRDVYPNAVLHSEIVYAVEQDPDGTFWIGTYRNGLFRYRPDVNELTQYRQEEGNAYSLSNDQIYDILVDRHGEVWIGTNGGLNRYRRGTDDFEVFQYDATNREGLSNNTTRVLYEDSSGRLWIGTVSGGLNRLVRDARSFEHVTMDDGLSDNTIVSILEGNRGRLWLGTQQGLSAYDPSTGFVEIIDERDGLMGSEFQGGALRDADGALLFGGSHGVTRIDSSVSTRNVHAPPVHVTDVRVFQESIAPDELTFNGATITLGPQDSFVSFEFVGLDFEAPDSNVYSYRLYGFDGEWIFAGNRNFATYTNLPPGGYEFQVRAANADGTWTADPATMGLVVMSPWYMRWWAIALYFAAVALIVYGGWRTREASVLADKNQALERAISQLAVANSELERLSIHDPLTGVFNRRYFDSHLEEEWSRAIRSGSPVALLMADIDHFKRYNDTLGHVAGDRTLKRVADLMNQQLTRTTDFVARYGGEEFAAVLFETSLEGAVHVAERIRARIQQAELGEASVPVTISIGVAVMVPTADAVMSTVVEAADGALYTAKRKGRNRVETA